MSRYFLKTPDKKDMKTIYNWRLNELNPEYYSCREIKPLVVFEQFFEILNQKIINQDIFYKVFVDSETDYIKGDIKGFDINYRNHSLEFGYYMPQENRGIGLGKVMISMFIDELFSNIYLDLNKIYGTTSENNFASRAVLEKLGFSLDGKNREHYWIDGKKYSQYIFSLLKSEWKLINF